MSAVDSLATLDGIAVPGERAARGRWQSAVRFMRRNPRIPIFTGVMMLLLIPCLLASLISPYNPREPRTRERLQGPSSRHLLGTDHLGRDSFSRLLYGGRVSVPVAMMSVAVAAGIGVTLGVLGGYLGGLFDNVVSRWVDAQIAFPELLLAIAVANAFGQNLISIMLILGFGRFPGYFRLIRGQVLQAREFEYVNAARALGAGSPRIMLRHVLPNVLNPVIIQTSLAAGGAILTLASLGFVGLGPKAGSPDWGSMFNEALAAFRQQPWLTAGPGVAVFICVLSFYMLGDALRDALDPRMRGAR